MKIVRDLKLPFYLTGGTALSRFYLHHRFSDDLDFFINDEPNFNIYLDNVINGLRKYSSDYSYKINFERITRSERAAQIFIEKGEVTLKLDFINDIPVHFGDFFYSKDNYRIDSIRNILSNKISALYRFEMKDYVDLWSIAKNYSFSWRDILIEAKEKEVSLDSLEISNLFKTFPFNKLDIIKWEKNLDISCLQSDFNSIAKDMLTGCHNSLFLEKKEY